MSGGTLAADETVRIVSGGSNGRYSVYYCITSTNAHIMTLLTGTYYDTPSNSSVTLDTVCALQQVISCVPNTKVQILTCVTEGSNGSVTRVDVRAMQQLLSLLASLAHRHKY